MINDFLSHVWTISCADKQHSIEKKEWNLALIHRSRSKLPYPDWPGLQIKEELDQSSLYALVWEFSSWTFILVLLFYSANPFTCYKWHEQYHVILLSYLINRHTGNLLASYLKAKDTISISAQPMDEIWTCCSIDRQEYGVKWKHLCPESQQPGGIESS